MIKKFESNNFVNQQTISSESSNRDPSVIARAFSPCLSAFIARSEDITKRLAAGRYPRIHTSRKIEKFLRVPNGSMYSTYSQLVNAYRVHNITSNIR